MSPRERLLEEVAGAEILRALMGTLLLLFFLLQYFGVPGCLVVIVKTSSVEKGL